MQLFVALDTPVDDDDYVLVDATNTGTTISSAVQQMTDPMTDIQDCCDIGSVDGNDNDDDESYDYCDDDDDDVTPTHAMVEEEQEEFPWVAADAKLLLDVASSMLNEAAVGGWEPDLVTEIGGGECLSSNSSPFDSNLGSVLEPNDSPEPSSSIQSFIIACQDTNTTNSHIIPVIVAGNLDPTHESSKTVGAFAGTTGTALRSTTTSRLTNKKRRKQLKLAKKAAAAAAFSSQLNTLSGGNAQWEQKQTTSTTSNNLIIRSCSTESMHERYIIGLSTASPGNDVIASMQPLAI